MTVIRARVPMAEMLTYEQYLTSPQAAEVRTTWITQHYDEVPHQAQAKIIATSKAEQQRP